MLRRRLFDHSNAPWEGETLALKVALIEAMEKWETLAGGGLPWPHVRRRRRTRDEGTGEKGFRTLSAAARKVG